MKLLMTADPGSGAWHFALDLASGLGEQGVEVLLATLGSRPHATQRREARAVPNVALAESDFELEWCPGAWDDVRRSGDWLMGLATQHGVDVVHCNHLGHGALPWDVPVLIVTHACVASWWQGVHGEPAPVEWDRYVDHVGNSLRSANAVIAPSAAMLGVVQRTYGPIVDGAVIHSARCPMPHASARKEPYVFASGRVADKGRNFAALDRITNRLSWPVRIAGSTQSILGMEPEVAHAELVGRVTTRAMGVLLKRAAIYALPAYYDPAGLSVLDAARAGCALVLGDIPSLRELWDGAACFVNPHDDGALASTIQRLIDDPHERALMARAARQRSTTFSHERCVREYLLAYRVLRGGYERLYDGVREAPQSLAYVSPGE